MEVHIQVATVATVWNCAQQHLNPLSMQNKKSQEHIQLGRMHAPKNILHDQVLYRYHMHIASQYSDMRIARVHLALRVLLLILALTQVSQQRAARHELQPQLASARYST